MNSILCLSFHNKIKQMKNIFSLAAFCLVIAGCSPSRSSVSVQYSNDNPEIGYDVFYNDLSPYGRWIDYPEYGYVWVPTVEVGFRPYASNGHWAFTSYGWTWVSNYSWGWATFHYGRWMYEDGYGWMWMPGHQWAPAWVMWGRSGGYYGWAPLAPRVQVGVSVGWTPPSRYWNFVPSEHITQTNINNYVINRTTNITEVNNIEKNVTIINNTNIHNIKNYNVTNNYYAGPQREEVEKATHQRLSIMKVATTNKPGQTSSGKDQLVMYRPAVKENNTADKPAPSKFEVFKKNKPLPENINEERSVNSSPDIRSDRNSKINEEKNNNIINNSVPVTKTKPADQGSQPPANVNKPLKENNHSENFSLKNDNQNFKSLKKQDQAQTDKGQNNYRVSKHSKQHYSLHNERLLRPNKVSKYKDKRKGA